MVVHSLTHRSIQACSTFLPIIGRRNLFSLPKLPNLNPFDTTGSGAQDTQSYHERKILPYTQKQLFDVVSDVSSYHRFLPFCKRSRVLTPLPPNTSRYAKPYSVDAELTIGFLALEESWVSTVTCTPFEMVQARSSSALFNSLTTTWRLQPASKSSPHRSASSPPTPTQAESQSSLSPEETGPTLVSIDLTYSFSNPLHEGIAAKVFGTVAEQMVSAFEKRCLEVYGRGTS
ncbi:hypothetical protein FRC03_000386 [Tulasnella sp. 419]|nr:hypothetical protein FRC03_000386 [Tulasnella sp. 419]